MKSESLFKPVAVAALIAIVLYAGAYYGIEHRRARKGPWQVTFTNPLAATPAILIHQPALAITNLQITFPGAAAPAHAGGVLTFNQPKPVPFDMPFGQCVFMDTTFLPGTVVLDLFGYQIQLLPRVLTVSRGGHATEYPWQSEAIISLPATNAPQEMQ